MDSAIRKMVDTNGIVTIWFDQPGKSVNTLGPDLLEEFTAAIETLQRDLPMGIIFASAKPHSFFAGADLMAMRAMSRAQLEKYLRDGQQLFLRIAQLPIPTVAAIGGDCLGGGLELALACSARIAADVSTINIGAPEVKLGLIPAWGGTVRLPDVAGLKEAVALMSSGKTIPPREALRLGIVDKVIPAETLLVAARKYLQNVGPIAQHCPAEEFTDYAQTLVLAEAKISVTTYGHYPAPLALLDVVRRRCEQGVDAGLDAERQAFLNLIETGTARNLLRLFFLRRSSKKWADAEIHALPAKMHCAGIVGGGTMGSGIAHALIRQGIDVRLIETDTTCVANAMTRVRRLLDEEVSAERLDTLAAEQAFNHLTVSSDWSDLSNADLVIEAAFENLDTKHKIFADLDRFTRPETVLATNTSSFTATDMAASAANPQRVLGLHFFNPVSRMPLVEIVRTPQTNDTAIATAVSLVNRLGKVPLVINDSPGFLVNRLLIPYLAEALMTASEGTSITTIDEAMVRWGMPMGPFELMDLIGLDISLTMIQSLASHFSDRILIPAGVLRMLDHGLLGKKTGHGFYIYDSANPVKIRGGRRPANNDAVALLVSPAATNLRPAPLHEEAIQWRLILMMANEAVRTLSEGITHLPDAIDLGTVLGLGFAPFRGGLATFIDHVGTENMAARLSDLSYRHGGRFTPADLLRRLAAHHLPLSQFEHVQEAQPHEPKIFHNSPS